jgi:transcriptional regulator with XRE-family HTH domain
MSQSDHSQNAVVRFGAFIRERRIELQITAREVATAIGMQPSNFSNMEHGVLNPPREASKLAKLAEVLQFKTAPQRKKLFDLAAKTTGAIPVDIAEIISSQDAIPLLLRTIGNRKLTKAELQKIVDIVHGKSS